MAHPDSHIFMDLPQSASRLHRKLQPNDANSRLSPPTPQPFPGLTVLPPPAYTPTPQTVQHLVSAYADPYADESESEEDEYYEPPPPITIKVDAPLKIIGHANIVCSDTQTMTTRLASAVVASIQRTFAAAGATANARPLDVAVGCGVTIAGSKNIVGDGMAKVFAAKAAALERNASSERAADIESRKRRAESVSTMHSIYREGMQCSDIEESYNRSHLEFSLRNGGTAEK
ncbi:hypothetical protein FGG08_000910 [Glutinoglossum americanum]|uniref:Uncharacterized protein n=1 Tax=Glutinoglossum americanum TaxID=1670608 RepID=A0A9P8I7Y8_9PEZI|nr:hypothetical protein FGG08_000910 [Glutinoglossum americanum]